MMETMELHKTIPDNVVLELIRTDNRCDFICDYLNKKQIKFKSQKFDSAFGVGENVVVEIHNNAKDSVLISAHYDDTGIYDNCGGVFQLLILCEKLSSLNISNYKCNYVLIFTDQEESFQQGIYHYLKFNSKLNFKYHLNIDGLGVGEEVMLYNSFGGHLVVNWLVEQEKVILLTDSAPFTALPIDSYHLFSCYKSDAVELSITQKLHIGFKKYFDEDWCLSNFNEDHFFAIYTDKILNLIADHNNFNSQMFFSV